jgi:hypothetical protein
MGLSKLVHNLPTGISKAHGFKGLIYDKGERVAMSAALGAAKGYYYDKLVWKGIGIEAIVGVIGTIASALFPHSGLAPHLERAGDAGLQAYAYAIGASWGAQKAGRGVTSTKALPSGQKQVVGHIPPRSGGAFVSAQEMMNYSNAR